MKHNRFQPILFCVVAAMFASCSSELSTVEYLEKARAHVAEGQLSAATIEARNAVKGDQNNADARLLLGELFLKGGDAASAEKELRKARELGVQDNATRSMLASTFLAQDKFDELLALGPDGLEPDNASQLLATRSMGWFLSGELPSARQDADQALQIDPALSAAILVLARVDAAENDMDSAADRVKALLDGEPANGEAWEFLGDLERFANRPQDALMAYTSAVENSVRPLGPRLKRAHINVELENASEALKDLDALTGAGVKLPDIQWARGQLKLRAGDLLTAQGHFEEALTLATDYAPAIGSLALNHLLLGNLGQAEQFAKRLMTETNGSSEARRLLAAVYLENGRYALAQTTIEPIVSFGNADLSSIRLLITALLKQAKYDDGIALINDFVRNAPRNGTEDTAEQLSPVLLRLPSEILLDETVKSSENNSPQPNTADQKSLLRDEDRLLVSAVELLGKGELTEALNTARELENKLPDSAAPLNLIGRIYLRKEDLAQARNAFENAVQLDDTNATARQYLALLDTEAGDLNTARSQLEELVKKGAQNESVLLQLSRIEARSGNESAMLDWIQRARTGYPDSVAPALLLARYHASRGEPERALETLAQLHEQAKERPDVLQVESAALIQLQRFEDAIPKLDRLIEFQPEIAQWRFLRALAKSSNSNNQGALEDLNAALELDPNHAPSQAALANVDIQRGQLDTAFSRVETLRDLIPGSPELEQIEARYEARKSEPINSATASEGAAGTTVESTEQVLNAAHELWINNERDKAIGLLNAWLQANPQDFTARLTLANSYVALEQTDAAITQYETVLQTDEQNLPDKAHLVALNNLAWYLREVDSDRAVGYAQKAVELAPESVAALDTLAMIHLARNDAQAAKAAFDKAVQLGAEEPSILYNGATIELALGNNEGARALLQPLIEGNREFPEAEEAAQLYRSLQ